MLKTNCKTVIDRVQAHVLECATERVDDIVDYLKSKGIDPCDDFGFDPIAYPVHAMRSIIRDELDGDKTLTCFRDMFEHHVRGLGFGDLMHDRRYIIEWLEETPEEADRYTYDKSEALYINLIYREFQKLMHKELRRSGDDAGKLIRNCKRNGVAA